MARLTSELIVSLVDRVTGPARRLSQTMGQLPDRIAAAQALNTRRMDEMRGQYFGAAAGAYALANAIKAPVTAAMSFESAMADVKKVVDFETPDGLKQFERDIIGMSQRMSMTAVELTEIVAAAGQGGIARADLLRFAEQASKVGTAFDITANTAGESMAKLKTGLGLTVDEVFLLADSMNHLSNTQAATAADILSVVRGVGAQGKQFGFAATEVAAFGSAMVAAGAAPEIAATSFLNMGKALTKGTSATKRQSDALKLLGLEAGEVAKRMQEDAAGTTVEVMQRLAALPEHMQAAVSSDLFGDEARALGPLLTNLDLVRESLGLVADENNYLNSAQDEATRQNNTTAGALKRFHNNITAVAIAIGDALLPPLNRFMETLTPLIQRVADLAARFPKVTSTVVLGTSGLVGLRVAAIGAQWSLGFLRGAVLMIVRPMVVATAATGRFIAALAVGSVTRFTAAFRAMRAAVVGFAMHSAVAGLPGSLALIGRGLVGLLNPIRLVKVALRGLKIALVSTGIGAIVVALGMGAAWIMENWEGVKASFASFGPAFTAALGPVGPALEPVLGWLSDLWSWITKVTGPLDTETWVNFGKTMGTAVGSAVRYVVETFQKFQAWIQGAIDKVIAIIPDFIKKEMGIEVTAQPLTDEQMQDRARSRAEDARDRADTAGWFASDEEKSASRIQGERAYAEAYRAALAEMRAENERLAEAQKAAADAAPTDFAVPEYIFPEPASATAPPPSTPDAPTDTAPSIPAAPTATATPAPSSPPSTPDAPTDTGTPAPSSVEPAAPVAPAANMPPEIAALMNPGGTASGTDPDALAAQLDALAPALADMQGRVTIDMTALDVLMQRIASAKAALSGLDTATRAAADRAAMALDRSRSANLRDRPTSGSGAMPFATTR